MIACRDVWCIGKANHVVVRIQAEGNVIRNKKYSVSGANHGLLIPAIGQTDSGRPLPFVQRNVVAAAVHSGLDIKGVAGARRSRGPVATRNRAINGIWIPIRQVIEAFRPRPLKLVAQTRADCQLRGYPPSVVSVKGAVGLLSCYLSGNLGDAFGLINEMNRSCQLVRARNRQKRNRYSLEESRNYYPVQLVLKANAPAAMFVWK